MTTTARLPFGQTHPLEVPPELRELQSQGTIHRVITVVGDDAWLVTGYAEVRQLMDDDRLGHSHRQPHTAARSRVSALFGGPIGDFDTDLARHAKMRVLLQPHFSAKRLRALLPRVEELTAWLLDELAQRGPPADLHDKLARPLPIQVICEHLGVPFSDRDCFGAWVHDAVAGTDRACSERAVTALFDYCLRLVERKRERPADDVISRLCSNDNLSDAGIAELSMMLLFAGYETTVAQIWAQTLALLTTAGQWQTLLTDPALIPKTVEELLRATMVGGVGIPRYAREDILIDDVTIRAGDLVLLDNGAANHDPAAFPDPDRLNIGRQGVAHLSFGYGSRFCIGAALARMELNTVFSQLIPRFPSMRLAVEPTELIARRNDFAEGLVELPVSW